MADTVLPSLVCNNDDALAPLLPLALALELPLPVWPLFSALAS